MSKEVEQVESVQNGTGNLQQGQQGRQEQANMNDQQTAQTNTNGQQTVQISIESATQMVLDKVPGATSDQLRINLDYDDGISKYEGELRYEGFEYDFEIDANSGTFLEWKEEKQDLWD